MFTTLMNNVWDEFARYIFNVEVEVEEEQQRGPQWSMGGSSTSSYSYAGGHAAAGKAAIAAAARRTSCRRASPTADLAAAEVLAQPSSKRLDEHEKIGRNDPCWCGSGKYKKCHGA